MLKQFCGASVCMAASPLKAVSFGMQRAVPKAPLTPQHVHAAQDSRTGLVPTVPYKESCLRQKIALRHFESLGQHNAAPEYKSHKAVLTTAPRCEPSRMPGALAAGSSSSLSLSSSSERRAARAAGVRARLAGLAGDSSLSEHSAWLRPAAAAAGAGAKPPESLLLAPPPSLCAQQSDLYICIGLRAEEAARTARWCAARYMAVLVYVATPIIADSHVLAMVAMDNTICPNVCPSLTPPSCRSRPYGPPASVIAVVSVLLVATLYHLHHRLTSLWQWLESSSCTAYAHNLASRAGRCMCLSNVAQAVPQKKGTYLLQPQRSICIYCMLRGRFAARCAIAFALALALPLAARRSSLGRACPAAAAAARDRRRCRRCLFWLDRRRLAPHG